MSELKIACDDLDENLLPRPLSPFAIKQGLPAPVALLLPPNGSSTANTAGGPHRRRSPRRSPLSHWLRIISTAAIRDRSSAHHQFLVTDTA